MSKKKDEKWIETQMEMLKEEQKPMQNNRTKKENQWTFQNKELNE